MSSLARPLRTDQRDEGLRRLFKSSAATPPPSQQAIYQLRKPIERRFSALKHFAYFATHDDRRGADS
jgi:hypothetical protein